MDTPSCNTSLQVNAQHCHNLTTMSFSLTTHGRSQGGNRCCIEMYPCDNAKPCVSNRGHTDNHVAQSSRGRTTVKIVTLDQDGRGSATHMFSFTFKKHLLYVRNIWIYLSGSGQSSSFWGWITCGFFSYITFILIEWCVIIMRI